MSKKKKAELRQLLRGKRKALNPTQRNQKSLQIASHVRCLPDWFKCKRIAVYSASDGEIDPIHVTALARATGKNIFLPVVKNNGELEFALWHEDDYLTVNRFKILEPAHDAPRTPIKDLDIVFLPLVGWDGSGNRLGMGGGFYDKTLSAFAEGPCLVGLGFAMQKIEEVPSETGDVPLDFVITEDEVICTCRKSEAKSPR